MAIDKRTRIEKLQFNNNREAVILSALSSGKMDKYEYLTREKLLPPDKHRLIKQARLTDTLLGNEFEKQVKTIEEQFLRDIY